MKSGQRRSGNSPASIKRHKRTLASSASAASRRAPQEGRTVLGVRACAGSVARTAATIVKRERMGEGRLMLAINCLWLQSHYFSETEKKKEQKCAERANLLEICDCAGNLCGELQKR